MPKDDEALSELIPRYPWGRDGFRTRPSGGVLAEELAAIEGWIDEKTRIHGTVALALIARFRPLLERVADKVKTQEGVRFVYRLDDSHLVKSPRRILEKLAQSPELDFTDFTMDMDDIGRFRVVVNFLSDIDRVREAVCGCYQQAPAGDPAAVRLAEEFGLVSRDFRDEIAISPADRKKGQRSLKGYFKPLKPGVPHIRIEVQVQTQLQEAWDKKDHYLIYEPRRQGLTVEPAHERESFAMSELLYVADLTFDRLRERIVERRANQEQA